MADGQGFVLKDDYRRRERNELGGCHCPNIWALFLMFIENDLKKKPEIVEDKKKNSMTVTRRFSASWWMLNMLLIRREDA